MDIMYSDKEILDFVCSSPDWTLTEGCPCINTKFHGNEIFVCLYTDNNNEDFIEIEVIQIKTVDKPYGVDTIYETLYTKEYYKNDSKYFDLCNLYLRQQGMELLTGRGKTV